MRVLVGATLAVLLAASPAAADDYGEKLCKQYMPPGTPCACVGPILDEEFDEEELEPLMQFLRAFMTASRATRRRPRRPSTGSPPSTARRPSRTG